MFTCKECGREFGQITGKHLKTHGINTVAEYLVKYPGAETVRARRDSPETLERKRVARTGKKHSDESKAKIGAKHKGKKRTEEEIDKWRASYKEYLDEHGSPMLGKDRGAAFKAKMSVIAKARPKEMVDTKVKMMQDARRGSKATPEQRENYVNARLKYIEENPDKLPKKFFNTTPERQMAAILDEAKIVYKRNVNIGGRLFDFKIGDDVLIEIDGPYHWNFKMYGNRSMPDQERIALFQQAQERDNVKTQIAIDKGYHLYRIRVEGGLPEDWQQQLLQQGYRLQV